MKISESYSSREGKLELTRDSQWGGTTRVEVWGIHENEEGPIFKGSPQELARFAERMAEFAEKAKKFAELEIPRL